MGEKRGEKERIVAVAVADIAASRMRRTDRQLDHKETSQ